jgi:SAM-dependent methyltransferase
MAERTCIDQQARQFFEDLWQRGDYWEFDYSEFEQKRFARLLALLNGQRYARVLEIGCGAGAFTHHLAHLADYVLALDISPTAIEQARTIRPDCTMVHFRQANVMEYDVRAEGPWDLIVFSDTMCYLGWLYSFFDVGWLVSQLFAATRSGGYCLFANAMGNFGDMLLLPWLIHTYRDLFRNVGYRTASEEIFCSTKHGVPIETLITLFTRVAE